MLGLTHAASARDLHEILYEELKECSYPNNLHPDDIVGACTYIQSIEEQVSGDLECINLRTIGYKNVDLRVLQDVSLPIELLVGAMIRPKELEDLCKKACPVLAKKIVCISDRKVYRQAPKQNTFLL